MIIYNIIFGVNFLLAILNIVNKRNRFFLLKVSFVIMSIFFGFNYTNGIDWVQYQKNFLQLLSISEIIKTGDYYGNIPKINRGEIFFYYSMILFKSLGFNYEIYQWFFLTVIIYIIYKLISRFTEYPLVTIFIYYCSFMFFNFFEPIFRQLFAMSILYISIDNIKNRKELVYLFRVILAYFFHTSAICFGIFYFIPRKKIRISILLAIFCLAILIGNYLENILSFIVVLFPFLKKYLNYFNIKHYGLNNSINLVVLLRITLTLITGFFVEKNRNILLLKDNKVFYLSLNFYWISETFFILSKQMTIFYRMQYYTDIFYIIILTFLIKIILKKYGKTKSILLLSIIAIFYYGKMYNSMYLMKQRDPLRYFPYTNYILELMKADVEKSGLEKIKFRLKNVN